MLSFDWKLVLRKYSDFSKDSFTASHVGSSLEY